MDPREWVMCPGTAFQGIQALQDAVRIVHHGVPRLRRQPREEQHQNHEDQERSPQGRQERTEIHLGLPLKTKPQTLSLSRSRCSLSQKVYVYERKIYVKWLSLSGSQGAVEGKERVTVGLGGYKRGWQEVGKREYADGLVGVVPVTTYGSRKRKMPFL